MLYICCSPSGVDGRIRANFCVVRVCFQIAKSQGNFSCFQVLWTSTLFIWQLQSNKVSTIEEVFFWICQKEGRTLTRPGGQQTRRNEPDNILATERERRKFQRNISAVWWYHLGNRCVKKACSGFGPTGGLHNFVFAFSLSDGPELQSQNDLRWK